MASTMCVNVCKCNAKQAGDKSTPGRKENKQKSAHENDLYEVFICSEYGDSGQISEDSTGFYALYYR